ASKSWFVVLIVFFFFFQAEDGIRDLIVTGVQTCALPIWDVVTQLVQRAAHRARGDRAGVLAVGVEERHDARSTRSASIPRTTRRSEERRVGKECRARWAAEH